MLTTKTPTTRSRRVWPAILASLALALGLLVPLASTAQAVTTVKSDWLQIQTFDNKTTAIKVSLLSGVPAAAKYTVEWSKNSSFKDASSRTTSDKVVFLNYLSGSTTYYVRVTAGTQKKTAKIKVGKPRSVKPTGLAIDNLASTSIELSWVGTADTWGYLVKAVGGGKTFWTEASGTYATIEGLTRDTEYTIRVYPAVSSDEKADGSLNWPAMIDGASSATIKKKTSKYYEAPKGFEVAKQNSGSVVLSWNEFKPTGSSDGFAFKVQRALNTAMTRGLKTVTVSAKLDGKGKMTATLSGLSSNTPYYVRLYATNKDGKQVSDKTGYRMAKTLIPQGTITGTVSGVPDSDVFVEAYDAKQELAGWAEVSGGKFSLSLRPDSKGYRLRYAYIGKGDFISAWYKAGSSTGVARFTSATYVPVSNAKESAGHPSVKLTTGAGFSGTIKDAQTKTPRSNVDITVLDGTQVVARDRTDGKGKYTVTGLRKGRAYKLRIAYRTDGYKRYTENIEISADGKLKGKTSKNLAVLGWYRTYGTKISGSKAVGSTVKSNAPPWVAGTTPATHSAREFRWQLNGKTVKTQKSSAFEFVASYKLPSSARGKRLSLEVVYSRAGYKTTVKESVAYVVR